jgi:hypothetical protein
MSTPAAPRPTKLYRYAQTAHLERALAKGEFRLHPAAEDPRLNQPASPQILPFGEPNNALTNYLVLSLSATWDERLFNDFPDAECCLIIHDTESFGERIHRAAQRALPAWTGIDAGIAYGVPSPLGKAFTREKQFARQKEWLFAWRPTQARLSANPVIIEIGSLAEIAEIRVRKP